MRKLASIRTVSALEPIAGADFIVRAKVDGWKCVVGKDDFKPGDKCVFFEIDAFIPIEDRYELLRKTSYREIEGRVGFRIKTIEFKKCLSQGLALPLSKFPEVVNAPVGMDVTGLLNILNYDDLKAEFYLKLGGEMIRGFPSDVSKTDYERIQNIWDEYSEKYADVLFEISEKIDGESGSFVNKDSEYSVCCKECVVKDEDGNAWSRVGKQYGMKERLLKENRNIAVQGEVVGTGVRGSMSNRYRLSDVRFLVFNIFDIDRHERFKADTRIEMVNRLSLSHVPIIGRKRLSEFASLDALLDFVDGPSALNKDVRIEGMVFKGVDRPDLHFKILSNKDLLSIAKKD